MLRPKVLGKAMARVLETRTAGSAVGDVLAFHRITDDVRAGRLETEWTELVGPKIAQQTRPAGVRDRTLWVEVATSPWLKELTLLEPQILGGLLERLGEPRLFDKLKFRLAARSRYPTVPLRAKRPPPKPSKPLPPPATGAAREAITREVATVDDEELRELIARIRITHDR